MYNFVFFGCPVRFLSKIFRLKVLVKLLFFVIINYSIC